MSGSPRNPISGATWPERAELRDALVQGVGVALAAYRARVKLEEAIVDRHVQVEPDPLIDLAQEAINLARELEVQPGRRGASVGDLTAPQAAALHVRATAALSGGPTPLWRRLGW